MFWKRNALPWPKMKDQVEKP